MFAHSESRETVPTLVRVSLLVECANTPTHILVAASHGVTVISNVAMVLDVNDSSTFDSKVIIIDYNDDYDVCIVQKMNNEVKWFVWYNS